MKTSDLFEGTKSKEIGEVLDEWRSKKRTMGCVAATNWLCSRVEGFRPLRLTRYTKNGDLFEHVVATDGKIRIDLAPYNDLPSGYNEKEHGNLEGR